MDELFASIQQDLAGLANRLAAVETRLERLHVAIRNPEQRRFNGSIVEYFPPTHGPNTQVIHGEPIEPVPAPQAPQGVTVEELDEKRAWHEWSLAFANDRVALAAAPPAPDPREALAARPLLEAVARMGDRIGQHTVSEITVISDRAAAWLAENPPGQPVAIEPRGCPAPGACSCVEPPAPAPPPDHIPAATKMVGDGDGEREELAALIEATADAHNGLWPGLIVGRFYRAAYLLRQPAPSPSADGPAVPEGREPAAVAQQGSAPPAADGEREELAADLDECAASCVLAEKHNWAKHMRRAAALLRQPTPTAEEIEAQFRAWWSASYPSAPAGPHAVASHVAFALHLLDRGVQ